MLHTITWSQFLKFILIAVVVYYGWVLFRYYGTELKAILMKGGRRSPTLLPAPELGKPVTVELMPEKISADNTESDLFKVAEKVTGLLTEALKKSGNTEKLVRAEIIERSQDILSGYHYLTNTQYETTINELLIRICKADHRLDLSKEDIKKIWN